MSPPVSVYVYIYWSLCISLKKLPAVTETGWNKYFRVLIFFSLFSTSRVCDLHGTLVVFVVADRTVVFF